MIRSSAFTSDVPLRETDEYKAESRKVTRYFERYSSEDRASMAASHRLGHLRRQAIGEYFYVHADRPDVAFRSRQAAVMDALIRMGVDVARSRRTFVKRRR